MVIESWKLFAGCFPSNLFQQLCLQRNFLIRGLIYTIAFFKHLYDNDFILHTYINSTIILYVKKLYLFNIIIQFEYCNLRAYSDLKVWILCDLWKATEKANNIFTIFFSTSYCECFENVEKINHKVLIIIDDKKLGSDHINDFSPPNNLE